MALMFFSKHINMLEGQHEGQGTAALRGKKTEVKQR